VRTPERAPDANAFAEQFVRSINEECLDRLIPIGERHFRRSVRELVAHYHQERNHQGLNNELIAGALAIGTVGSHLVGVLAWAASSIITIARRDRRFDRAMGYYGVVC
jgi:integrase-like protein